jgi:iron(III) transport system ATP-binding protein
MAIVISVKNLVKTYVLGEVEVRALRGMNLDVERGEFLAVIGPSGSGKSTFMHIVGCLDRPTSGQYFLDGEDVSRMSRDQLAAVRNRKIGFVFQGFNLLARTSALDNVELPLLYGGTPMKGGARRKRAMEALAAVGLEDRAHHHPNQLSGGQQQRVALARALAPEPDLLLLDEPFSNLDIDLRERLSIEVRSIIKATGTTAILVTHDQHEAFAIADQIGIMNEGRIEQWDTAYDLYHQPTTRFVADFVGQGVFLRGIVAGPARVVTELGDLDTGAPLLAADGLAVDLLVRPDDIVHDDAAPWRAEVAAKAFRGADFLYTLVLPSGSRVLSLVPSHHNHAIGERIGIRLAIDHVVAFPAA